MEVILDFDLGVTAIGMSISCGRVIDISTFLVVFEVSKTWPRLHIRDQEVQLHKALQSKVPIIWHFSLVATRGRKERRAQYFMSMDSLSVAGNQSSYHASGARYTEDGLQQTTVSTNIH